MKKTSNPQIYRHGDCNIDAKVFPNDPYKDEQLHWPEGYAQLTKVSILSCLSIQLS